VLPERDHRLLHARDRRLQLELRCRADEAIAVVERAVMAHGIEPGELTLGSDNGSAFTARRFRARLGELGIRHRRGGYRAPESQAFIESWFGKLKDREVWLNEYETLADARRGIGGYVDRYHHRPHSGLNYRTPARGAPDLGGSTGTTKTGGLACQRRQGAGHDNPQTQSQGGRCSRPPRNAP
jgi:transposase InsO family protein